MISCRLKGEFSSQDRAVNLQLHEPAILTHESRYCVALLYEKACQLVHNLEYRTAKLSLCSCLYDQRVVDWSIVQLSSRALPNRCAILSISRRRRT